jgi:hypothetical protein
MKTKLVMLVWTGKRGVRCEGAWIAGDGWKSRSRTLGDDARGSAEARRLQVTCRKICQSVVYGKTCHEFRNLQSIAILIFNLSEALGNISESSLLCYYFQRRGNHTRSLARQPHLKLRPTRFSDHKDPSFHLNLTSCTSRDSPRTSPQQQQWPTAS